MRVYGRDFSRNTVDVLRLYFDASRLSAGPDYVYTWNLGRFPGGNEGSTAFSRAESWNLGRKKPCSGIQKSVSYSAESITVEIPRSCVGNPAEVRWAGFTGRVDTVKKNEWIGRWDDFPKLEKLPNFWARLLG